MRSKDGAIVSFCEHCQGQRFDRARVLRALRKIRREARLSSGAAEIDAVVASAQSAVRALDIPHIESDDEDEDLVVH